MFEFTRKKICRYIMLFNTQPYNSFAKKNACFLSGILKVICIHSHLAHRQGFSSKG